jgi:hypothetical protein
VITKEMVVGSLLTPSREPPNDQMEFGTSRAIYAVLTSSDSFYEIGWLTPPLCPFSLH